jgi:hypothetical protein
LAIKASGHDYLGRSTAKSYPLIWTHKLRDIKFTDSFVVAGEPKGSAVTVGSGVALNTLYGASKAAGKILWAERLLPSSLLEGLSKEEGTPPCRQRPEWP